MTPTANTFGLRRRTFTTFLPREIMAHEPPVVNFWDLPPVEVARAANASSSSDQLAPSHEAQLNELASKLQPKASWPLFQLSKRCYSSIPVDAFDIDRCFVRGGADYLFGRVGFAAAGRFGGLGATRSGSQGRSR